MIIIVAVLCIIGALVFTLSLCRAAARGDKALGSSADELHERRARRAHRR